MYNGQYYLMIDGKIFPKKYMIIPTYSAPSTPIIINDYRDGNYDRHIDRAPQEDVKIQFTLRQLYEDEYLEAISFIKEEMTIEYFEPRTGEYKSAIFTYEGSLEPTIDREIDGRILYCKLKIKLIRKRGS